MNKHRIRTVKPSEVPEAYDIFCQNREKPWSIESFTASVNSGVCLVCAVEDLIVAYVLCSAIYETAEVLDISVQAAYQRSGFGNALLTSAIAYFRSQNLEKLMLEVDERNMSAIGLYTKCGWHTIDTRKNYYRHSDGTHSNALIMSLPLR